MKLSKWVVAGVLGLVFQATASGQIYESEDAEGVPDFSDTPTAGAEVVDLPATNLMNAPPAEAPAPPAEAPRAPVAHAPAAMDTEQGESGAVHYGGDEEDNVRAQRRVNAERVENALPGVEPRAAEGGAAAVEGREVHHEGGAVHRGRGGRR